MFLRATAQTGVFVAVMGGPLSLAAMGARALGEEQMLRRALDGYDAYMRKVRFRLMPGVW